MNKILSYVKVMGLIEEYRLCVLQHTIQLAVWSGKASNETQFPSV